MDDIIDNMNYDPTQPIILGLAGKAATGKTSVAEYLVPKAQINTINSNIVWDHLFFALPLYEMATIKTTIMGLRQADRQLYSLHSVVYDLFGGNPIGNIPEYDELINLVRSIYAMPVLEDGKKPRSFLQNVGDLCRNIDENCFVNWTINKAKSLYRNYAHGQDNDEVLPFCVIISDVRFVNEAQGILDQPNGILVCYEASDLVRDERILRRDGVHMTEAQKNHKSEQQIDAIKSMSNLVINTDNLSIVDQSNKTIELVNSLVGVYA